MHQGLLVILLALWLGFGVGTWTKVKHTPYKWKVTETIVYEIFLKYDRMICDQQIIPTFSVEYADVLDAFNNTVCDLHPRPKNRTD